MDRVLGTAFLFCLRLPKEHLKNQWTTDWPIQALSIILEKPNYLNKGVTQSNIYDRAFVMTIIGKKAAKKSILHVCLVSE